MLSKAGAAIIVCCDPQQAHHQFKEYAVIDSTLASQNILLAAEASGLALCGLPHIRHPERMDPVRRILNIPKEIIPLNVIPIGHPTGEDAPKNKFRQDKIHREVW